MVSSNDNWVRIFDIPETSKHKRGFTIYKVISMVSGFAIWNFAFIWMVVICLALSEQLPRCYYKNYGLETVQWFQKVAQGNEKIV